jgi:thiol-disulfide isomerase/thioredoxin
MKKVSFYIVLFNCFIFSYSQEIKIIGNFENAKDSTKVWFSKPVDDNPSHYFPNCDNTLVISNVFEKSFSLNRVGFVQIASNKDIPSSLNLICDKGDRIKFHIKKKGDKLVIDFEGSNAEGHELINNSDIYNKLYLPIYTIIKDANTSKELLDNIENLKISNLKSFDSLYINKKISKSFYSYCKLYDDTEVLCLAFMYLNEYLKFDKETGLGSKLTGDDIKEVIRALDKKYDIFSKKYKDVKTVAQIHNIQNKCAFIDQKILEGVTNDLGLWNESNGNKYNYFAPKDLQEFLLINEIYNKRIDEKRFNYYKIIFDHYEKIFPKSVYFKELNKHYEQEASEKFLLPFAFASFSKDSRKLNVFENKEFKSLPELISAKFNGKAVFVDLWATYCAPCKSEFSYSDELHEFLKNNNIEMLYVSIDNKKVIDKWKKDVYEYSLMGNHYFATNSIVLSLQNMLKEDSLPIPRYLLFDSKGDLVLRNSKRPSEGQNLYNEILKALN